jgi:hypothetical protein
MKHITIFLFAVIIFSCKEKIPQVTSIDQIPGKWRWESTCGGILYGCNYPSKTNFATIEFTAGGNYIEMHNDTVYLQTPYSIVKYDDVFGSLVFENLYISRAITVLNNRLMIDRGELQDTYSRIK